MSIVALLVAIGIIGFVAWLIMQIPMPEPFAKVIIGILCVVLVLYVLQWLGLNTGLPAFKLV